MLRIPFWDLLVKVAFIQRVWFVFQISKSPKKYIPNYYPELEIWICCLLLLAGNLDLKFRIVIWNIFFWRYVKQPLVKTKLGWILEIWLKPPYIHEIFTKMQYGKKTDVFQIRSLRITTRPRLQNGVAKNLLWNSENHIWTTIIRTPKHVSFDCFTKKIKFELEKSITQHYYQKNISIDL